MRTPRTSSLTMPRARIGRILLAIAALGLGIQNAVVGHLSPGLPPLPDFLPWGHAMAIAAAIFLIPLGLAVLGAWNVRYSSLILAGVLFYAAALHLIHLRAVLQEGDARTAFLEPLAMACAAFVLHGLAHHPRRLYLLIAARILFATTLVVFGVQHFLYTAFLAALVPTWIPFHVLWIQGTGAAFIAVGIAMISGILARPAAQALAAMFLSWILVLHIPAVLHEPHNPTLWASLLVAIGMCGSALLMSTSPRLPSLKQDLQLEQIS